MADYTRSKSYGYGGNMQLKPYYGVVGQGCLTLRCSSASYAQAQADKWGGSNDLVYPNDFELKKGKSTLGSRSRSKAAASWVVGGDPEFQRKKRVASYKRYSVEGKVKGSFRKSFGWLKDRYSQVVHGW